MNEKIPAWLRKPMHRKEVIATDKGWAVKDTGEILVRVSGLSAKIAAYFGTESTVVAALAEPIVIEASTEETASLVTETLKEEVTETPKEEVTENIDFGPTPDDKQKGSLVTSLPEEDKKDEQKKSWIHNDTGRKLVDADEVAEYLAKGWKAGRGKNK